MLYDPVAYLAGEKESNVEAAKRRAPNEPVFRQYELYENERWVVIRGWSPKNLLPTERPHWTDANNVSRPRDPELANGWEWGGEWKVSPGDGESCDAAGWQYSWNFGSPNWHPRMNKADFVRRRRWTRTIVFYPPAEMRVQSGNANDVQGAGADHKSDQGDAESSSSSLPALSEHDRNFQLITSSLLQEVIDGDADIPSADDNAQARETLVDTINEIMMALAVEEKALSDAAVSVIHFVKIANKAQAASESGAKLSVSGESELEEWQTAFKIRPPTNALDALVCTDDDIVKRCKDLEYRCSVFLQARENLSNVEHALKPGSNLVESKKVIEEKSEEEEEEAEL